MLVSHILREKGRDVLAIPSEATLFEAARVLAKNQIGALVVTNGRGKLAGIIAEREIVRAIAEGRRSTRADGGADGQQVATCEENDTIDEIMETMTLPLRSLPVVGRPRCGMSRSATSSESIAETHAVSAQGIYRHRLVCWVALTVQSVHG
jgi:CBS domain-containing protein